MESQPEIPLSHLGYILGLFGLVSNPVSVIDCIPLHRDLFPALSLHLRIPRRDFKRFKGLL